MRRTNSYNNDDIIKEHTEPARKAYQARLRDAMRDWEETVAGLTAEGEKEFTTPADHLPAIRKKYGLTEEEE